MKARRYIRQDWILCIFDMIDINSFCYVKVHVNGRH